ncbi:MAG: nitric oxide reductase activation protein [Sulfuricella sp.]|nr:nitric oxide reductase activation protein [Sulfuricella sp.]
MSHTDDGEIDLPFSAAQLDAVLNEYIPATTWEEVAAELALLGRTQQEFVLEWCFVLAGNNATLAFGWGRKATAAFACMGETDIERWLIRAMDVYDKQGLSRAFNILNHPDRFAVEIQAEARRLALPEALGVLELFVCGLAGRTFKIAEGDAAYTDSETFFLPASIEFFPRKEDNFLLYKGMVAHLWAQVRFGTYTVDWLERVSAYPDPERALAWLHALEAQRLEYRLRKLFSGLLNDLDQRLGVPSFSLPPALLELLAEPGAGVTASLDLLEEVLDHEPPTLPPYIGLLKPELVRQAMQARLPREKEALAKVLGKWLDEIQPRRADTPPPQFSAALAGERENSPRLDITITLDGKPLAPPDKVRELLSSIALDLGEIPPEYLVPAGPGDSNPDTANAEKKAVSGSPTRDAVTYPEWDHERRSYRKEWCVVREKPLSPQGDAFVQQTLTKYSGKIHQFKRAFEMLRGEERTLKRQQNGDDIDFDALVDAYADLRCGRELSEHVFTRRLKVERNLALMLMVDMSGSTKGHINDTEREALVLLCEALERLGDRYAIYGFSGMTRLNCEIYPIKEFQEPYGDTVRRRIEAITPRDYTRMGVAIRHLSQRLNQVDARVRLLITLSDGKPDDFQDNYRGAYGIEDTRMALLEAKRSGIHPFCITIDREGPQYLPHMYGAVNYAVIDDVKRLPLKIADIYRKLTT